MMIKCFRASIEISSKSCKVHRPTTNIFVSFKNFAGIGQSSRHMIIRRFSAFMLHIARHFQIDGRFRTASHTVWLEFTDRQQRLSSLQVLIRFLYLFEWHTSIVQLQSRMAVIFRYLEYEAFLFLF